MAVGKLLSAGQDCSSRFMDDPTAEEPHAEAPKSCVATPPPGSEKPEEPALQDQIAQAVLDRFDKLPGRGKPQGRAWTVLAGVVLEDAAQPVGSPHHLEVLTLATGTRCIGVSAMVSGCGRVVHDCHAEVLCRRALQRYLFREIERGAGSASSQSAAAVFPVVLERLPGDLPCWRLRPGARLHFYVSTLPCGECTLVPIHDCSQGTLKRKILRPDEESQQVPALPTHDRNRTGAKPSAGMPLDPKADGIDFHCSGILRYKSGRSDTRPESRSVCYSCSEKICRWNHVGWQGAMLSRLIERPLTMASMVIGGHLFDTSFVEKALFTRAVALATPAAALPPKFLHTNVSFNHSREVVESPGADLPGSKVSTAGLCVVWSAHSEPASASECAVDGARLRSISGRVRGFYDVLIGHTGERQGLRGDRQARKPNSAGPVASAPESTGTSSGDSWVSPLSKRLMAEDAVRSLARAMGSEAAAASWLLEGDAANRPSAGSQAECDGGALEALAKRRRVDTNSLEAAFAVPYTWLKTAMASQQYLDRRLLFHGSGPFVHWRRKQQLAFNAADNWEPAEAATLPAVDGVDSFRVDLPQSFLRLMSSE